MTFSTRISRPVAALAVALLFTTLQRGHAFSATETGQASVIKIYVTLQRENFAMPWQSTHPANGSGTGFIISGKRILTNAHLIADARFIQVQKEGDPHRYRAEVLFVGHDCDLAVLTVDDVAFYEDTQPVRMAQNTPSLNDEVVVLGYPMGGDRLSVTKGVVSRLGYANYMHSGVDQHFVLQVDAAINPGNSGGPVYYGGRVVGLAFQGIAWADNIGYAIPLPVINHFLDDIADGHYHGYPELGVVFMGLRNPALRADLGLPKTSTGAVVTFVDPFGSAKGRLLDGDVMMAIDGHTIANDATIEIDGERFLFAELLERKQWGDSISLNIWRDKAALTVKVPLDNPDDPFVYRNQYNTRPPYFMIGGLVFSPLSREYLETLQRGSQSRNVQNLYYVFHYAKEDGLVENRDAFVVLSGRLSHPVNTYMEHFTEGIVESVNEIPIGNLHDLRAAMQQTRDGYLVIKFFGQKDVLVLDAAAAALADAEISQRYDIPAREYLEELP